MINHHRYKKGGNLRYRGRGVMDVIRPMMDAVKYIGSTPELASKIGKTAVDVFNIGKNTKDIVTSIRGRKKDPDMDVVIDRINKLRVGRGFSYI